MSIFGKNFFRRKSVYSPSNKTDACGDTCAEQAVGDVADGEAANFEFLVTTVSAVETSIVESLLRSENVPYILRSRTEGAVRVILGASTDTTDIYVPASQLDFASELVSRSFESGDGGDDAEKQKNEKTEESENA